MNELETHKFGFSLYTIIFVDHLSGLSGDVEVLLDRRGTVHGLLEYSGCMLVHKGGCLHAQGGRGETHSRAAGVSAALPRSTPQPRPSRVFRSSPRVLPAHVVCLRTPP